MAYNFSAHTNGAVIYNGNSSLELSPQRGAINNNLELFWLEVDLGIQVPDIKAVLHVGINDMLLHMDFQNYNHIGLDAVNRNDQFHRSPVNFSIWELRKVFKLNCRVIYVIVMTCIGF